MEKVRFEAFNVKELRVLRRACYEAGAAFGDPGHTAAERETLDDLAVEILGELKKKEAAAARQKQEEPLEKTVAKAVEDSVKGVVGKLPFAPKVFQSPAPPKERVVQRPDIPAKAKTHAARRKRPQGPGAARSGKVYRFLVCALREVRPGTRLLCKNAYFFVLLPGVRRENGAQKYAPGQDLVRVRQRLPLPYEHPGCRV